MTSDSSERPSRGAREFATTHWSAVRAAGETTSPRSESALAELCQAYWYPLYAYVRRQVRDEHEAQDLTQAFLAQFLAKRRVQAADPARGRFRAFLVTALKHFLNDERDRARAQKRGGGGISVPLDAQIAEERYTHEPADLLDPEKLFERRWALTLLEEALGQLEQDWEKAGKRKQFELLHGYLEGRGESPAYAATGVRLGMSEGAVKVAVHRLRRGYREALHRAIAKTVADPAEIDEELQHLLAVLSS